MLKHLYEKYFALTLTCPSGLCLRSQPLPVEVSWSKSKPSSPFSKTSCMYKAKSVFGIPYSIFGNQYLIFGIWYSVLGISQRASPRHPSQQHPAQSKIGIWSLKLSVQYFVFNFRFLVFSIGQRARPRHPSQKPPAQKGKSVFGIRYFGIQYWSKSLHFSKKSWTKKQNLLSVFKKSSALLFFPGSKT